MWCLKEGSRPGGREAEGGKLDIPGREVKIFPGSLMLRKAWLSVGPQLQKLPAVTTCPLRFLSGPAPTFPWEKVSLAWDNTSENKLAAPKLQEGSRGIRPPGLIACNVPLRKMAAAGPACQGWPLGPKAGTWKGCPPGKEDVCMCTPESLSSHPSCAKVTTEWKWK